MYSHLSKWTAGYARKAPIWSIGEPQHWSERTKIVEKHGCILPRGEHGELYTSGYSVQQGYFDNDQMTEEVMDRDGHGRIWMHTGDQCFMVLLRQWTSKRHHSRLPEDIEIEERILQLQTVAEAVVVGVGNKCYGESISAFLQASSSAQETPTGKEEIRDSVYETLGQHNAPVHIS